MSEAPEHIKHWSGQDPSADPIPDICPDCHYLVDECICEPEADELQQRQDKEYIERHQDNGI